jgi:HEAT repeat protein
MRVRHWLILALALPLTGCGGCSGCGKPGDPRDAAPDDEKKPPAELSVRLQAATALPKRGELPPELLAALGDDSPHVRRAAVFTVRRSGAGAPAISAALTPLLKDRDLFVRVVAAEALWETGRDADALAAMKKVMRDGEPRARTRAVQALGEAGPAAKDVAPELTALLKETEPDTQVVIARAQERIRSADVPGLAEAMMRAQAEAEMSGDYRAHRAMYKVFEALGKDAAPPLIEAMKSGRPQRQKSTALAVAALGREGRAAVPALTGLLNVRQLNTHRTAAEVLGGLGPDAEPAILNLMDLLDDEDPETAWVAAVALGGVGRPALQPLLIRLRSKKAKNDLATVALAKLGKDAVPSLLDALKSDDPALRLRAALALGGMASPPREALSAVLALLAEWTEAPEGDAFAATVGVTGVAARRRDSAATRRLVAAAGRFRGAAAEAVPILAPLVKDRSPALRRVTAEALGAMGPAARPAIPALRELAADTEHDYPAAAAAAAALVAIPLDQKEDVPILVELLKNNSLPEETRARVVETFGRLGPDAADAVPALLEVLEKRKADRATVYLPHTIGRVGDAALPHVVKAVRTRSEGRWAQGQSLRYLGKPGRDALLKLLQDEDEELRRLGADHLRFTGPSPEVAAALLDALNDLDGEVRENAAQGLHAAGAAPEAAVPALTKRLLDPKPLARAVAALELRRYGAAARPAVPALLDALKDDDDQVRRCAAAALQRTGVGREHMAALIKTLEGKGPGVRDVLFLLPDCGDDAREAAPALRELRKDERFEEAVLVALWHVAQDGASGARLLERLRQPDRSGRAGAASALGGKGTGAALAVPALCDALRDPDALVRESACRALGRIGAGAAVSELISLLQNDETEAVREAALAALVEMKSVARAAIPALKALRKKASPRGQVELNDTLWKIAQDDEALTALAALLADRDACAAAADVLGHIGAPAKAAVPALRQQGANRERTLREGAAIDEALRKVERN